jgi:excisionase family DNA binding protein
MIEPIHQRHATLAKMSDQAAALERTFDALLSVEDTARMLGVSAYTVRQLARDRRIPAIRLGRFWRFRRSSLDEWIAGQERGGR